MKHHALCPSCAQPLHQEVANEKTLLICHSCGGGFFSLRLLCSLIQSAHVIQVWEKSKSHGQPCKRACPICRGNMLSVVHTSKSGSYELDVCQKCEHIWFDTGEFDEAPRIPNASEEWSFLFDVLVRNARRHRCRNVGEALAHLFANVADLD